MVRKCVTRESQVGSFGNVSSKSEMLAFSE